MAEKKRELTHFIDSAIKALVDMHADAAKLEFFDNDEASRRLKRDIVDFEHTELKNLKEAVKKIREAINSRPSRSKNKPTISNN